MAAPPPAAPPMAAPPPAAPPMAAPPAAAPATSTAIAAATTATPQAATPPSSTVDAPSDSQFFPFDEIYQGAFTRPDDSQAHVSVNISPFYLRVCDLANIQ